MLKNYLKIAFRNLRKHKAYSLINIAGLAIGLACFTLIMLFVQDEWSYDRYHPNADRLYRIAVEIGSSPGSPCDFVADGELPIDPGRADRSGEGVAV